MTMHHQDHDDPRGDVEADRRAGEGSRMRYEALVEIGADSTGGFEAESVDVSLDGLRVRTAYLPQPGESLVCRFDGYGGEVVAEGEVAWCRSEKRGGEFGVRFTRLDADGERLLRDMCDPEFIEEDVEIEPSDPEAAQAGARVRLHISGLGSPMRARVRDTASGEVLIGSNLEFLRVGRDVELEDVEAGGRRIAHIEHVGVDVDPESQIPQLVVALRYERVGDAAPLTPLGGSVESPDPTTAPFRVDSVQREITPSPTVIDSEDYHGEDDHDGAYAISDAPPATLHTGAPRESIEPYPEDEFFDDETGEPSPSRPAVHRRMGKIAREIAPKITAAGAGAKGVLGGLLAGVKQRRAERAKQQEAEARERAPKRTTAPPPSGALRSDGRRVFREQPRSVRAAAEAEEAPVDEIPVHGRKRAVFGAALGLLAVLAIYFGADALAKRGDAAAPPPMAANAPAQPVTPGQAPAKPGQLPAAPAAQGAQLPPTPAIPGQENNTASAKVPLFGATPLSTTEPVAAPGETPPGAGTKPAKAADADDAEEEGDDDGADDGASSAPSGELSKEWGVGQVENATVLKLRMDGTIEGLRGVESATGFTITIPGRRSVSSAAGLARKDKRIDGVKIVNYEDKVEITIGFRGEVPAFVAKVKGKRLVIEIGNDKKSKKKKSKKKKKKKRSTKASKKRKSSKKSKKKSRKKASSSKKKKK